MFDTNTSGKFVIVYKLKTHFYPLLPTIPNMWNPITERKPFPNTRKSTLIREAEKVPDGSQEKQTENPSHSRYRRRVRWVRLNNSGELDKAAKKHGPWVLWKSRARMRLMLLIKRSCWERRPNLVSDFTSKQTFVAGWKEKTAFQSQMKVEWLYCS